MSRFPRLTANGNESDFPNISNVRTFEYDNTLDYARFDNVQMNIILCKVPWDMGEAHVGQRTISGIGNVVAFEDKAARDAWFAAIPDDECYRFSTKYRELHRDNQITVPIPYDIAARYNYIAVYHEPMASAGDYVDYETAGGLRAWFWFVREVEFLAPNSTRLHLLNDAWQTFIYDIDIPYMVLERGHAPMSKISAANYLSNPIANNSMLLAMEDDAPDAPRITQGTHEHVFNASDMHALIITSANMFGTWGSKANDDWTTPATQRYVQGVPARYAFAIAASSFSLFMNSVNASIPQFMQTVQAVCFISSELLTLGTSFEFGGVTCYEVDSTYKNIEVHRLAKTDFGYPSAYADIAKLYTYPYSVLVVGDSNGNETEVRVEDTDGTITASCAVSLVYPWIAIQGAITSVGNGAKRSISFANVSARTMPIGGNWHELLISLDIPCFGIVQAASVANDYGTHFDRKQSAYTAGNARSNANDSADTAKANADASANNITNNAAVTTAGNSAITSASNTSASEVSTHTQTYNSNKATTDNALIQLTSMATIAANDMQGSISAASGMASSAIGAIGSAATGDVLGAVGGIANGIVGAASTMASTAVANGLTSQQGAATIIGNNGSERFSNTKTADDCSSQISAANSITAAQNTVTSSQAANTSATMQANATRDQSTAKGNATRDYNTSINAISNQIAQAALGEPAEFGDFANGETATTRPLALYSHVVTQDAYTVRKCGDDFLRYGYSYNANWAFDGNWCPMAHFCYWRLSDFWVQGLQIPDMYVDKIRFFLFGGVTVWKDPADIGNISIYENN